MAKSITIRDVAAKAGVAVSTVSRTLSGVETPIPISAETRQRVLLAARELNYRPHPGARLLRSKATNMFGLIVREIEDPFFAQLIKALRSAAKERGFELVIGYAEADPTEALRISELMMDMRYCDGLFLVGDLHETPEDLSLLERMGWNIPLVLVSRGSSQLVGDYPFISTDNRAGTRMALDYLKSLGHSQIAFLGGGRPGDLNERQQTYREYMTHTFGNLKAEFIRPVENSLEGGYAGMRTLLTLDHRPGAVFASDDNMAIGALRAASEAGVSVPTDISLIGFDDIRMASFTTPRLTTVRQPVDLLSRRAVELLDGLIKGSPVISHPDMHISLMPELIVRESCAPV
jgi:DNA-binding LacI/PurR family transcriptional regulator